MLYIFYISKKYPPESCLVGAKGTADYLLFYVEVWEGTTVSLIPHHKTKRMPNNAYGASIVKNTTIPTTILNAMPIVRAHVAMNVTLMEMV